MAFFTPTKEYFENAGHLKEPTPVLLDFVATWCGPCRMIAPTMDQLAETYDSQMKFLTVDVDEFPGVAKQYGIMSVPSVVILIKGQVHSKIVGALPKTQIEIAIKAALDVDKPISATFEQLKETYLDRASVENTIHCAVEEMAEATKVLMKYLRSSHKFSIEKLTEETAHALLMLEMIKRTFSLDSKAIEKEQIDALKEALGNKDFG